MARAGVVPALLCLCLALSSHAAAEDVDARLQRYDGMIESLNAPSERRARVLETIYNELRGPHTRDMQETLRDALFRSNTLILQGVVEAMAMLGDPQDVGNLEALLATSDKMEVKATVIRLLPAFCLAHSERARFNYIRYAVGYERVPAAGVLEPLRRPPLTRRGYLDPPRERMRNQVTRCLAQQFDPVAAALKYMEDRLYGQGARNAVVHYVGDALGNDPTRWGRIWAAQGSDFAYTVPDEVEELRLASLLSLSDMGAEGLPEIIDALASLAGSGNQVLRQAVFDAMAVMCRVGFGEFDALGSMQFDAADMVEADNWCNRRYDSNVNLAVVTAAAALATLFDAGFDPSVFTAAAGALGAALSYPVDYPDADGRLEAAKRDGLSGLGRLLLMPDLTREKRSAVTMALGDIGAPGGIAAIVSIINSPYSSPEFGLDGTRMAESAVEALRTAAVGAQEGRDDARQALLALLADPRVYPPLRAGAPPVGLAHMVLWRLQRLAKSTDTTLDPALWKSRLGW